MNKLTFLKLMKTPDKISDADFIELETLVKANPYFQNGHCVLAHASKYLKKPSLSKRMNTAAIYSTDRNIFKQYIQGQVKFGFVKDTADPASKARPAQETRTLSPPIKVPTLNPDVEQDTLVGEIYENLKKWKASRENYLDYDRKHPEEIVIENPFASPDTQETSALTKDEPVQTPALKEPTIESKAETGSETKKKPIIKKAKPKKKETKPKPTSATSKFIGEKPQLNEVEKLKNQIVEEVEAEEKSISKAFSEFTQKVKKGNAPKEKTEPVKTIKDAPAKSSSVSKDVAEEYENKNEAYPKLKIVSEELTEGNTPTGKKIKLGVLERANNLTKKKINKTVSLPTGTKKTEPKIKNPTKEAEVPPLNK